MPALDAGFLSFKKPSPICLVLAKFPGLYHWEGMVWPIVFLRSKKTAPRPSEGLTSVLECEFEIDESWIRFLSDLRICVFTCRCMTLANSCYHNRLQGLNRPHLQINPQCLKILLVKLSHFIFLLYIVQKGYLPCGIYVLLGFLVFLQITESDANHSVSSEECPASL